jgi:DNA-binding protein H-NS
MAKSLAKLNEQIAKLQKEVEAIQSTVIARIKREIAQHGLTAEHLFNSTDSTFIGNGRKAAATNAKASSAKKLGAAKPAKYADDQGNSWHGIGKRPQWIRAALNAGHAIENFLVSRVKLEAKKPTATETPAPKTAKKTVAKKRVAPAKKATKAAVIAKAPVKKTVKAAPQKKAAAKKSPQVKAGSAPAAADA